MKKFCLLVFILVVIGLGFFFILNQQYVQVAPSSVPSISVTSPPPTQVSLTKVIKVIDGDTIEVESGDKVRYIGINTPEMESSECYAQEATNEDKLLVLGKTVRLEKDVSETDKYGRLLRYVYVQDPVVGSNQEIFVNNYLVGMGYAVTMTVPPDVKYKNVFADSQNFAKENKLGLWGKCFKPL